jgi:hypothetical protein
MICCNCKADMGFPEIETGKGLVFCSFRCLKWFEEDRTAKVKTKWEKANTTTETGDLIQP